MNEWHLVYTHTDEPINSVYFYDNFYYNSTTMLFELKSNYKYLKGKWRFLYIDIFKNTLIIRNHLLIWYKQIARVANQALDKYFPGDDVAIIAEPGQFYVASAFTIATNIIARKLYDRDESNDMLSKVNYFIKIIDVWVSKISAEMRDTIQCNIL